VLEKSLEGLESISRQYNNELIEKRVESARLEQRIDGLKTTLEQLLQDTHERNHHVQVAQESLDSLDLKLAEIENSIDQLKQQIDDSEARLGDAQQRRHQANEALELHQVSLQEISKNRDTLQRQLDKWVDRQTSHEQEQSRLTEELQALLNRYRNDYQIDLLEMISDRSDAGEEVNVDGKDTREDAREDDEETGSSSNDRFALESQIGILRQELSQAGSVNLEALDELEQLQSRYDTLSGHERDLLDAKATLIRTMQKIDLDSQSLFLETLQAIRTNFQTLYRKSFGGGHADIVLENPEDPESGIEILATPPGKTTFSNSLLSGGEKALTAVALIMAFFQYRPSPFCVLDEVDAPFDEANIGRFVSVLNEFLDTTKFIVVTHSKKTMTVADMIYGVTMQESGVSRQVSVKFEEVNDRGETIRREPKAA
jgi:chromosome segregation protein